MFDWYHSGGITFLVVSGEKIYGCTKGEGLVVSNDEGKSWTKARLTGLPDSIEINTMVADKNIMVAGTDGSGIYISQDNGKNWKQVNSGLYDTTQYKIYCKTELENEPKDLKWKKMTRGYSDSNEWYNKILNEFKAADVTKYMQEQLKTSSVAINGNHIIAYLPAAGIFTTTLSAAKWEKVEIKDDTLLGYYTMDFAADDKNVFAYSYDLLHRSQDHGKTWKKLHINIPWDTAYVGENEVVQYERETINAITIKGKTIYAATSHGVFISYDEGDHWKEMNMGLPRKKPVSAITLTDNRLFVCPGDYQGVYVSNDDGKSWKPFNEGFRKNTDAQYHCGFITCFAVTTNKIFAGVWTNGDCPDALWVRDLKDAE